MAKRRSKVRSSRRRAWFQRVLGSNAFAIAISLVLHLGVFLGLYVGVFREIPPPAPDIIPEARLVNAGGLVPPAKTAPLRLAQPVAPLPMDRPKLEPDALPITSARLDTVLSPSLTRTLDPAASVTAQALPPPTGTGPVTRLFGQAGNAYKVVYVVDVSASLMIYLDPIVEEMRRSIQALKPSQQFHIVLAGPRKVVEFTPKRLVSANAKHKQLAMQFVDTMRDLLGAGAADPIAAMERAFGAKPELIYFLTDGDYTNLEKNLLASLGKWNADRTVKITTIGFTRRPAARQLLQRIAREHGGHFRSATEDR